MSLRYYQREAIGAAYRYFGEHPDRNPCIVLPTGAGKTHVLVEVCRDVQRWGGRVIVLAHVKELLDQAQDKLKAAGLDVGVYSASLGKRQKDNAVIVGGVQSVYRRGLELCGSKPFSMAIVDEAHRIPTEGDGMYVQLLSDLRVANPKLRILGLTATPYRTGEGYVCRDDHFLNDVCYEANIRELIAGGYLCRLTSKRSSSEVDVSGVSIRSGDFVASEMEGLFNEADIVSAAVNELVELTRERRKVLIFCCGIAHASSVAYMLSAIGESVRVVTSEHGDRDGAIETFKSGRCKYLVNVNVLTEGFDATAIDAVILLRATVSPGLYYQMIGRGLRIDPAKQDCLVLDYGGNIQRHGTIDNLQIKATGKRAEKEAEAPVKPCPECNEMCHAALLLCPSCGFEFEQRGPNHEDKAASDSPLGDAKTVTRHQVGSVSYCIHAKRGQDGGPFSMRVTYYADLDRLQHICDEWICVEHSGYAYEKAYSWWAKRTNARMPADASSAVSLAQRGGLAEPEAIDVETKAGERFPRIIGYELGPPVNIDDIASEEELVGGVFEEEEIPW